MFFRRVRYCLHVCNVKIDVNYGVSYLNVRFRFEEYTTSSSYSPNAIVCHEHEALGTCNSDGRKRKKSDLCSDSKSFQYVHNKQAPVVLGKSVMLTTLSYGMHTRGRLSVFCVHSSVIN